MKKLILLLTLLAAVSCKKTTKNEVEKITNKNLIKKSYPKELEIIFQNHGGIENWKKNSILSFSKGKETHTINLKNRKTVIKHPDYSLGFDGKEVWLKEEKKGSFKKTPTFYYNLYFYFYAMPFVLADDGIVYQKAKGIKYNRLTYPGIKISYKDNIGNSSKDNYILYYHPKSLQMKWLAYTVTFKSKRTSDKYRLLKYDERQNVNGLVLPKKLIWYKKDNNGNPTNQIGTPVEFTLVSVSQSQLADSFFDKPKD